MSNHKRIPAAVRRLISDDAGQGLTEYALIIAFVAVAVIATLFLLGGRILNFFEYTSDCLAEGADGFPSADCAGNGN